MEKIVSESKSNVTSVTPKKKRTRSPSSPRPAFVIVQIRDDAGQPTKFDKSRLHIVAVERSAEKVMEAMENGEHEHAFYLRVIVPVGPRPAVAKAPAAAA
jgi:hypothetical protein